MIIEISTLLSSPTLQNHLNGVATNTTKVDKTNIKALPEKST